MHLFWLLLIIIAGIVLFPLIKGWLWVRSCRDEWERVTRNTQDQYREQYGTGATTDEKVYSADEGEVVEYEDVECCRIDTTDDDASTTTIVEEQITDAEFEELPEK